MEFEEYQKMYEVEEAYWWFVGKWRMVSFLLRKLKLAENARILDLGCGCGLGLSKFSKIGRAVGLDYEYEALKFCRRRLTSPFLVQGSAVHLPFKDETFDLIVALDLLEHIEQDTALLKEIHRIGKPKMAVILSVPCYPRLYSEHDLALHHKRRYRKDDLRNKIRDANFRTKRMTFFNMSLFLPIAASRMLKKKAGNKSSPQSDFYLTIPRPINFLFAKILAAEAMISQGVSLPFGLSLYAVLEKMETS